MRRLFVFFFIQATLLLAFVTVSTYAWAQTTVPPDSLEMPGDTVKNAAKTGDALRDSIRAKKLEELELKSDLKSSITYSADSFMLLDMETKTLYLHKNGSLKYEEMTLDADSVAVNWEKNLMSADGLVDSTGQKIGRPLFKENDQSYRADRMAYNFKSKKGLVTMARTKQDENYIIGEYVKKQDDSTYYIRNGKFTSCELDHPHYYIKSSKLKVIPRKRIITGPLMLVIEDFPLPLIVPFGFFPNQTGHRSGVVMPTYGESAERGFFLRNGGYYFAISDKLDLLLRGDVFSKGGYRLEVGSAYNVRYKFEGNFQVEYGVQRFGERDDPEGLFPDPISNFWVRWNHDQTINPQAKLTSNVNAGSSGFLNNNSYNEQDYLTNTLKSTINFSQSFANSPWRLNVNLDHSQNTQTRAMSLDLPNATLNRTRYFPFKGKNATGDKWFQKIGLTYTMNLKNQLSTVDSLVPDIFGNLGGEVEFQEVRNGDTSLVTKRAVDFFNNGMSHTIPISTQLTALQYINIQPALNFKEYWYFITKNYYYDPNRQSVESVNHYGFEAARDFNFQFNTSTRLYGIFGGGGKRQAAVRHTLQPSLGYRFQPDFSESFWGYYEHIQADTTEELERFNRFAGGIQGAPSAGKQQVVNYGLNNVLELKFRSKQAEEDSTETETEEAIAKKDPYTRITLLDALSINGSYNFGADSLKLAPFNFVARTNILNNKFNFQMQGSLDPYAVNFEGRRINTFRFEKNGNIGRISTLNFTFNTTLAAKSKKDAKTTARDATPEELSDLKFYRDLYVDFNIPWRLNLGVNLGYTNTGRLKDTTLTLNMTGDVNLTPKWKVGYTTGYDFKQMDFSYTSLSLYRDLHCWEMSLTWIPFGERKSYNFSINVKSATLKDLKLTKRRDWQDRF
jgi:lipopolysaccharide export system protein LptA